MIAAFALGAEGVQIGTRFAASVESSAHENYKQAIVNAKDDSTVLIMKKVVPVRLIKNKFAEKVIESEKRGTTKGELIELLGKGRERTAIFEGNLDEGEIEAGQISGLIKEIMPAGEIVHRIMSEYYQFNTLKN